ncbi:C6 transcription factor [Penicillium canescens]|uniref:C6 transcription factor n=1 Tax=Penicillium canescens TaxID=5083 RepID=A0AAD6IP70_PENCN|nr:C6 transcription factor [Penicillium canescens]
MPLTSSDSQPLNLRRRKRLKVDLACEICRRRKVKCDGARPACGNCLKRSDLQGQCAYTPIEAAYLAFEKIPSESGIGSDFIQQPKSDVSEQPQRLPNSTTCGQTLPLPVKPVHNQRSKASAFQSDPNITCADSTSQTLNVGGASRERFGSSSSVTFTGQIKAAIDARFGGGALPPSQGAVPLVDASLFPPFKMMLLSTVWLVGWNMSYLHASTLTTLSTYIGLSWTLSFQSSTRQASCVHMGPSFPASRSTPTNEF